MLICIYRDYIDYTNTVDIIETLSRDDIDNCVHHQITCTKLTTDNTLFGVVCVDHVNNLLVRTIQPG